MRQLQLMQSTTALGLCMATLFGGWVILIGVSRILLGEHYFSDVLAGFLGGLGFLMLAIDREIRLIRPSRPADPSV